MELGIVVIATFSFMKQHAISSEGFSKLKAEWEDLKYVQRPAMVKQVQDAAAEGDRSENAAYTYGKMRLRDIDRRLRFLDRIVDSAVIVDHAPGADSGEIGFGAKVRLKYLSSSMEKVYQFVGPAEIDPMQGNISLQSPIGMALKGKKQGDSAIISTPKGAQEVEILAVEFI